MTKELHIKGMEVDRGDDLARITLRMSPVQFTSPRPLTSCPYSDRPLLETQVLGMFRQIVSALHYVHRSVAGMNNVWRHPRPHPKLYLGASTGEAPCHQG